MRFFHSKINDGLSKFGLVVVRNLVPSVATTSKIWRTSKPQKLASPAVAAFVAVIPGYVATFSRVV